MKKKSFHYLKAFIYLFIYSNFAFSQNLQDAFHQAGDNKDHLKTVLNHFKNTGEQEKYKAAVFLIENMTIHKSVNYKWIDEKGNDVGFLELEYDSFKTSLSMFRKLKDSIKITPQQFQIRDLEVISSNLLIKTIDMAFKEWKENPWSVNYDFQTFCEYILPHRSLIEPLEDWRKDYLEITKNIKRNVLNSSDPVEVCWSVSNELNGFQFLTKRPDPIPLLSPKQLLFRRQGNCPDLANTTLFASRAIGLAVSFEFTPHYAASSNRHFWVAIIDKNGDHIPFNGNIESNKLATVYNANIKRLGKVFRKAYSIQKNALASNLSKNLIPKGFLQEKNIIDVTEEYVSVGEVKYQINKSVKDSICYLNVFNLGRWRTIDWGKIKNGEMVFKNVGRDIVYLPSIYLKTKTLLAPYPILLDTDGVSYVLKPDLDKKFDYSFSRRNELKTSFTENNSLEIEDGKEYALFYWNKGWKEVSLSIAQGVEVYFERVPSNALLKLIPKKNDGYERIFIIDASSNKIKWY